MGPVLWSRRGRIGEWWRTPPLLNRLNSDFVGSHSWTDCRTLLEVLIRTPPFSGWRTLEVLSSICCLLWADLVAGPLSPRHTVDQTVPTYIRSIRFCHEIHSPTMAEIFILRCSKSIKQLILTVVVNVLWQNVLGISPRLGWGDGMLFSRIKRHGHYFWNNIRFLKFVFW